MIKLDTQRHGKMLIFNDKEEKEQEFGRLSMGFNRKTTISVWYCTNMNQWFQGDEGACIERILGDFQNFWNKSIIGSFLW